MRKYYKAFLHRSSQILPQTKGYDVVVRTCAVQEKCFKSGNACGKCSTKDKSLKVSSINNQNVHKNFNMYPIKTKTNHTFQTYNGHFMQRNLIHCPSCSTTKPSFLKICYAIYRPIVIHRILNFKHVCQSKAKERLPRISFIQNNRNSIVDSLKSKSTQNGTKTAHDRKINEMYNDKNITSNSKTSFSTFKEISPSSILISQKSQPMSVQQFMMHQTNTKKHDSSSTLINFEPNLNLSIVSRSVNSYTSNNPSKTLILYRNSVDQPTNSDVIEQNRLTQNKYISTISPNIDLHSSSTKYTADYKSTLNDTSRIYIQNDKEMDLQSNSDYLNKHFAKLSLTIDLHSSSTNLTIGYDSKNVPSRISILNQNELDLQGYSDFQETDVKGVNEHFATFPIQDHQTNMGGRSVDFSTANTPMSESVLTNIGKDIRDNSDLMIEDVKEKNKFVTSIDIKQGSLTNINKMFQNPSRTSDLNLQEITVQLEVNQDLLKEIETMEIKYINGVSRDQNLFASSVSGPTMYGSASHHSSKTPILNQQQTKSSDHSEQLNKDEDKRNKIDFPGRTNLVNINIQHRIYMIDEQKNIEQFLSISLNATNYTTQIPQIPQIPSNLSDIYPYELINEHDEDLRGESDNVRKTEEDKSGHFLVTSTSQLQDKENENSYPERKETSGNNAHMHK